MRTAASFIGPLLVAFVVGACGASATPAPSPSPSGAASSAPSPSRVPSPSPSPSSAASPIDSPSPPQIPSPSPDPSVVVSSGSPSAPSPSPSPPTSGGPSALPPVASPVDGVVIRVESEGLADVRSFTIRTFDGVILRFRVGRLDPGSLPVGHLTEHAVTGAPIRVAFVSKGGELVAVSYADAP